MKKLLLAVIIIAVLCMIGGAQPGVVEINKIQVWFHDNIGNLREQLDSLLRTLELQFPM